MRETNMRKFSRDSTSPGQRRCCQHCWHPCNFQPRTARPSWNSNLEGLTKSSQVSLQQVILLVHHTGLVVIKGRHRKSGRRRAALFQATRGAATASTQAVDQNQEASNPPGKASDTCMLHPDCTKSWIQRRDEK